MFFDKKIKALELKEEANKQKQIQEREIEAFMRAFAGNSYFLCTKKLGVLEYIGVKDIAFFTGLTHMLGKNYDAAINMFQKISTSSKYYGMRTMYLLEIYRETGNYIELSKILNQGYLKGNVLGEIQMRLLCLWKSDSLWVNEHAEEIKKDMATTGEEFQIDNESGEMFFQVCNLFAELLLAAGEMINQVAEYRNMYDGAEGDLACDSNVDNCILLYEKYCTMLSLARHVRAIKFVNEEMSLEKYALIDRSWDDKLRIFQSNNYHKQIMNIIVLLLGADIHSYIDRSRCVIRAMTLCALINPQSRAEFIAQNLDGVKAAYLAGEQDAITHVNYAYGEILGTKNDPYKLKKYFEAFVKNCPEVHEIGNDIAIVNKISRKAYKIWQSAERMADSLGKRDIGIWDYSTLSLQYFRIIEIVYSEKLLQPLAESINMDLLLDKVNKCDNDDRKRMWERDMYCLKQLAEGKQESLELGKIRTMLAHVVGYKTRNDECAIYLRNCTNTFLSDDGQRALERKDMLNVIGDEKLNMYRVPGAHTGYLPFSVACESRKYVLEMLPRILSWFK